MTELDELLFADEREHKYNKPYGPGPCPKCGSESKLRKGKNGLFYGCSNFPDCRGTREHESNIPKENLSRLDTDYNNTIKYSEKEKILIKSFGFEELMPFIDPISLYKFMMEKAFINRDIGKNVDSLRSCIKAINKGYPNRLTKEWDNLIILI